MSHDGNRTLVAGFGNLLLGDDGFGAVVVRRLAQAPLPPSAEVVEVGIGGMELIFALMSGWGQLIVIDAVRQGAPPGTLSIFTPAEEDLAWQADDRVEPHLSEPTRAMRFARKLDLLPRRVIVVGCEPQSCELSTSLSPALQAAVERAVATVRTALRGVR